MTTTTITLNGKAYVLPDEMTENNGAGHSTEDTAGTGDILPRFFCAMVDAIADASKNMRTTSASSVLIGTGAKTFVLATDIPFYAGERGVAIDTANSANYMYFTVTSYTSSTKTLVTSVASGDTGGSGTITSWYVASSGQKGNTGATGAAYDISASTASTALADGYTIPLSIGAGSSNNRQITLANFFSTISEPVNLLDNLFSRAEIKDYSETHQTVAAASTTVLDFESGNVITLTQDTNITTFTWSNPSATGKACSFTLRRVKDATGTTRTIAWPASVKWPAATAPTLTQTTGAVDVFSFFTVDAGTTWYGFTSGQAMA